MILQLCGKMRSREMLYISHMMPTVRSQMRTCVFAAGFVKCMVDKSPHWAIRVVPMRA